MITNPTICTYRILSFIINFFFFLSFVKKNLVRSLLLFDDDAAVSFSSLLAFSVIFVGCPPNTNNTILHQIVSKTCSSHLVEKGSSLSQLCFESELHHHQYIIYQIVVGRVVV